MSEKPISRAPTAAELANIWNERGRAHARNEQYIRAIADFSEAIRLDPGNFLYHANRGLMNLKLGHNPQGIRDYGEAIRLAPDRDDAYASRALLHSEEREYDLAIVDYNKALRINPRNIQHRVDRALTYVAMHDFDKASADFERAIAISPHHASTYAFRGNMYRHQGDTEAALADFNKAIELAPNLAFAYRVRGLFYRDQWNFEAALRDFDRAIQLAPEYALDYANRGSLQARRGLKAQAERDFDQAIWLLASHPQPAAAPEIYSSRGEFYGLFGETEKSLNNYKRALELDPNLASAHYGLGNVHSIKGDPAQAMREYNESIQLDPTNPSTFINRGDIFAQAHDYDKAIADFSEAIRLNKPRVELAYTNRARAYALQGRFQDALADLDEATKRKPCYGEAVLRRGNIRRDLGDFAQARADYEAAGQCADDAPAFNELAWTLATNSEPALRDGSKALGYAMKACELSQWNNPGYIDTLAVAYAEVGNFTEAISYQEKAIAMTSSTSPFAEEMAKHLELFHKNMAYHDQPQQ